jgi:DNA-damage-inducible protein J
MIAVLYTYNAHIGVIMLGVVNVTIRVDESVKKQSEQVFNELGLNITTAVNVFMRAVARQQKIPFELTLAEADPFFNSANQARLALSKKQIEQGSVILKTAQDLGLDDE